MTTSREVVAGRTDRTSPNKRQMSDNHTDVNVPIDRRIAQYVSGLDLESGISEERAAEMISAALDDYEPDIPEREPEEPESDVDLSDLEKRVDEQLRKVRLASNPDHVAHVPTGDHQDTGTHGFGAWGLVVRAEHPVHWREATVYAEEAGTTQLELIAMDYTEGSVYDLNQTVATRELRLEGGQQTIYPELTIPEGTYFITRDSENPTQEVVGMKRVATGVDWDELNASHDIPLEFECSWQIGRQPGTANYQQYRDSEWDRILHYYANPEFGYLDPVDEEPDDPEESTQTETQLIGD